MEISTNLRTLCAMAMGFTISVPIIFADGTPPPSGKLKPGEAKKKRIPSLERIYYYYDAVQLELETQSLNNPCLSRPLSYPYINQFSNQFFCL